MQPTPELISAIERERVVRARRQSIGDKLMDGPKLFDRALVWMDAGVRSQFPEADDATVRQIIHERLAKVRRMEELGVYRPVDSKS